MMYLMKADHDGQCFRCGEEYAIGSPLGVISVHTGGIVKHYAHPQCWLELGLSAIGNDAHTTAERQISKEQQAERRLILQNWAQLRYREKQLRVAWSGQRLDSALSRIEHIRDELRLRMAMLGGVPRSWNE